MKIQRSPRRRFHGLHRESLLLIWSLTLATPLAADSDTLYRQAIEATKNEDWHRAARLLREAIAEDPQPRSELSGGAIEGETAYLPHYYLGLALYRMGDCLRAPEHWRVSNGYSVIRQSPRYEEMTRLSSECESRFRESATRNAQLALTRSEEYLSILSDQASDTDLKALWERNPRWRQTLVQNQDRLGTIGKALEKTGREGDLADLTEVESQAAETLREIKSLLDSVLAEAEREVTRARTTPRQPTRPPIIEQRELPASLTSAIRAYFRADYHETLRLLSRESFEVGSDIAQGKLFEAAAQFALYRLGGNEEAARLDAAASAVLAGLAKEENLKPEISLFSPSFRSFFEQQRTNEP